jgi:pyruvate/2-oxoglutarate dehydrogenase complex dihydrolipoamide acyltransferase (E2) component
MAYQVLMPRIGITMLEGKITKWLKQQGDLINKDDEIAEIISEKIVNTITAKESGILTKILVPEDTVVEVGTVLAVISNSENGEKSEEKQEEGGGENPKTGDMDKIVKKIRALTPIRKMIGGKMLESIQKVPQGTLTTKADFSQLIELKNVYKAENMNVTISDMLIKVVAVALAENPILNSSIIDNQIVIYESINIGIGMVGDDTLYAPVIKNVQNKSVFQISEETKKLAKKVKEGTICLEDTSGATFTLSNLGMLTDIEYVTPIITMPQSAMLLVGVTKKEAVVDENDNIVVRPMGTFSLTVDHTNIDAMPVANFMTAIKRLLKNPEDYLK